MENETKTIEPSEGLKTLAALEGTPLFDASTVDVAALDQMISAHQLKYIEFLIQAEEERKLAVENLNDLQTKYPIEIQEKALEHSEKAMYDPDYFTRNKIDPEFAMPIQLVGVIKAKKEEAKQKIWKLEYHARLVERLRTFREVTSNKELEKPKTFWGKIKNIFKCEDTDDQYPYQHAM